MKKSSCCCVIEKRNPSHLSTGRNRHSQAKLHSSTSEETSIPCFSANALHLCKEISTLRLNLFDVSPLTLTCCPALIRISAEGKAISVFEYQEVQLQNRNIHGCSFSLSCEQRARTNAPASWVGSKIHFHFESIFDSKNALICRSRKHKWRGTINISRTQSRLCRPLA